MGVFHHFTSLAPGHWDPTIRCSTLEVGQTFYWRKVFSRASYDADRGRLTAELPQGYRLDADSVAAVNAAAANQYLLTCLRELLFECVRAEFFPLLPSRSTCMFLVENEANLDKCAARYGFVDPTRTVMTIETLDDGRLFRGRASDLDTSPIVEDILLAARRYWQGASIDSDVDDVEVLFTGPFRIVGLRRLGSARAVEIDGKGLAELFRA